MTSAPAENISPAPGFTGPAGGPLSLAISLDIIERAVLATVFSFFAIRMISTFELTSDIALLLLLLSEVLPIVLVLSRKWSTSNEISSNPLDWLLSFAGANAPLFSGPVMPGTIVPQELCSLVILAGLLMQISAKIVLWRSFGVVPANRGVKASGPYRLVRHPMYLGYTVVHIGFLMAFPSWWNAAIYAAALVIQMARILREEHLLLRDPAYREFATRVRYRLFPGLF